MCAGVWYRAAGDCFGHKVQRPVGDTELRGYSTQARVRFLKSELEFNLTHRWATLTTILISLLHKGDPPYTSKGLELCD